MKDQAFLQRLLTGTASVPMVTGIRMDLEIEVTEEFRGGVWVVIQRDVTRVVRLVSPPKQPTLPLTPVGNDQRDNPGPSNQEGDDDPEAVPQ